MTVRILRTVCRPFLEVVRTAGEMRSIELFLNFPLAAMNRTVLRRDPSGADHRDIHRMTVFWGDDSWRETAYTTKRSLFGHLEKLDNPAMAEAYRRRLQEVAGPGLRRPPSPLTISPSRRRPPPSHTPVQAAGRSPRSPAPPSPSPPMNYRPAEAKPGDGTPTPPCPLCTVREFFQFFKMGFG
jgi:hypothetical protein